MGSIKTAKLKSTTASKTKAIWTATNSHTGRTVRGDDGYILADSWSKESNEHDLGSHPGHEEFIALIPESHIVTKLPLHLLRGRCPDIAPSSPMQMGPPNEDARISGGRYNKVNQAVLYLCESEEGLRQELNNYCISGKTVYVQSYTIPNGLRIADFRSIPPDHFVAAAFEKAEGSNVISRGPENYVFSQHIGTIVSQHFDGMIVPGVRGRPGTHYSNVILFNPHPEWPEWVDESSPPYKLEL